MVFLLSSFLGNISLQSVTVLNAADCTYSRIITNVTINFLRYVLLPFLVLQENIETLVYISHKIILVP